jgi:hypothetical protein
MHQPIRLLLLLIAAFALMAGEASPPAVSISLPDVAHTREQLLTGPYGKMWQQPAVQKLCAAVVALPGAENAWLGIFDRIGEVRYELVAKAPKQAGQDAELTSCLALRLPAGNDPQTTNGTVRRDGDWWLLGLAGATPALPVLREPPKSDVSCVIRLGAFADLMPADNAATFHKVLAVLGLDRIDLRLDTYPGGVRENGLIAGCNLPFKAVDPEALAGFPEHPVSLIAVGIDGQALVKLAHALAAQTGEEALQRYDAELHSVLGIGLDPLLAGCDGTAVFAYTPGVPVPGLTLSLPASATIEALFGKLCDVLEPGSGARILAKAKTQVVAFPLPTPTPIPVMMRHLEHRWVISTDKSLIDGLAAGKPAPFPVQKAWKNPDGAVVLASGDTKAQVQTLLECLPMVMMGNRDPEVKHWAKLIQGAVNAALPHFQPSVLVMHKDPDGLRLEGENALFADMVPLAVLSGAALPAFSQMCERSRRANAGSNMRQIAMSAIGYQNDHEEQWPADFAELKKWSDGKLDDKLFQCPGHPEIKEPFLYVRPSPTAKGIQPVIIQDPACNRGQGSMVVYADGHFSYERGAVATAMWEEAKRLAALPKAKDGGIETRDWTTPTDIKGRYPQVPEAPK